MTALTALEGSGTARTARNDPQPARPAGALLALLAVAATLTGWHPAHAGEADEMEAGAPMDERRAGPTRIVPSQGYTSEMPAATGLCAGVRGVGARVDCWHDWLYLRVQRGVENVDHRYAAEDEALEPVPVAPLRIGFDSQYLRRPGGPDFEFDLDLDLALRLPNIERRLRIFITSDPPGESPNRPLNRDADLRAGVRLELPESLDFDIGARLGIWPKAYAALRWGIVERRAGWSLYPFSSLYVETEDGLGFATGITVDRWWGLVVARSATYFNWTDVDDEIAWDQTVTFAYSTELLDDRRYASLHEGRDLAHGVGVSLSASGERLRGADGYRAMAFYKRPVRGRWLYLSAGPVVRWDREYDWSTDYGFRIGLDALFWGLVAQ